MSDFSFGSAAPGGGFSFGVAKTAAAAPSGTGGFTFGTPTTAAAPQAGGFSFGNTQANPPSVAQPSSLFSFSTPAAAVPSAPTGGFSFGAPTASAATAAPTGGLAFGTNTPKFTLNTQIGNSGAAQPAMGGIVQPVIGGAQQSIMGGAMQPNIGGVAHPVMGGAMQPNIGGVTQPVMGGAMQPNIGGVAQPNIGGVAQPAMGGVMQPNIGGVTQNVMGGAAHPLIGGIAQPVIGGAAQPVIGGIAQPVIGGAAQPAQNAGFSFGATPAQTQPSLTGGFSFSGQPATAAPSAANPASTAATQPGVSFLTSAFSMAPTAPSATATATQVQAQAPATQQIAATLFSKPLDAASVSTATATSSTSSIGSLLATSAPSLFSLSTTTASALKLPTTVVQASASGTAPSSNVSAPAVMTYVQLENLINKWSLELEDQEKHFLQQATQVNLWDKTLISNGERITSLHREMEKVKLDQKRLDQGLDFILSQQKELEDILGPLEDLVKEQNGTIYLQHADEEREKTYKLAENIDAQLKRMSQDLKDVIEHLNTSAGLGDSSNPLQQICKILNAHMDSLQWVDQNSALLQRKVEQVTKECENRRKEQERGFPITFD
ncbi:nucleoporin-62 C-terminal-like protein isoform 2-T2 [Mantella aurantiaca]